MANMGLGKQYHVNIFSLKWVIDDYHNYLIPVRHMVSLKEQIIA